MKERKCQVIRNILNDSVKEPMKIEQKENFDESYKQADKYV